MKFVHRISKGSRYNQIYIPKENEADFEVGSLVEVRLLKKHLGLYHSKNLPKLSHFKEKLVKEIFGFLSPHKQVKQAFIFGSFLTKSFDYNDIDILLLTEKADEKFEEWMCNKLLEQFNLKLHILIMQEDQLVSLLGICPLTRSMLSIFVSDHSFNLPKEIIIDKNHIQFLLMMPEDLLEVKMSSKVYYDNLRRLIVIEHFLENKEEDPLKIEEEISALLKEPLFSFLKNDEEIDQNLRNHIRGIMKKKLQKIKFALNKF